MVLKIGDKVKIGLVNGIVYSIRINGDMLELSGKIATIKAYADTGEFSKLPKYKIDLDNQAWSWTEDMFEKSEKLLDEILRTRGI